MVFRLAPKVTAYLFIHENLQSDDPKDVNHTVGNDSIVGYVLNCEGQEWTIKTESTSEGKFGLIVYTTAGKPYMAGEGQFDASGRPPRTPLREGGWTAGRLRAKSRSVLEHLK